MRSWGGWPGGIGPGRKQDETHAGPRRRARTELAPVLGVLAGLVGLAVLVGLTTGCASSHHGSMAAGSSTTTAARPTAGSVVTTAPAADAMAGSLSAGFVPPGLHPVTVDQADLDAYRSPIDMLRYQGSDLQHELTVDSQTESRAVGGVEGVQEEATQPSPMEHVVVAGRRVNLAMLSEHAAKPDDQTFLPVLDIADFTEDGLTVTVSSAGVSRADILRFIAHLHVTGAR